MVKQAANENGPRLYSLEETGARLGHSSIWTIRKHVAKGNLRSVKLGKRVFVPASEIERVSESGLPSLSSKPARSEE